MILLLAPVFSLIALAAGGIATVAAIILNGPRRLRRRAEPPLVTLPPIPTPQMRQREAEEHARSVV